MLTTSATPAVIGTPVKFTAVFSAPFATPTGTVMFYDGSTLLGSGTLDATGTATFTISTLALGSHSITATYAATQNFGAATSNVLEQSIVPAPQTSMTLLASSLNPSIVGQTVTFTAAVSISANSTDIPSGSVTFTSDGASLGIFPLNAEGTASVSLSTLTLGNHNIVATYTGSDSPSTSNTLLQVVNPMPATPLFTMTVTPAAISVPIGNSTAIVITVTPHNGFNQSVALSCGKLSGEVTCTFDKDTIPPGGTGSTVLHVFATAPHDCNSTTPYFTSDGPTTWIGLLTTGSLIFFVRRRRRLVQGVFLTLALCVLPAITGCGRCTDLGVWPGNYTFTVSGVAASDATTGPNTSEVSTQTIQMVVHL